MDPADGVGRSDWEGRLREIPGGEVSIHLDRGFGCTGVGYVRVSEWTLHYLCNSLQYVNFTLEKVEVNIDLQ